METNKPKSKEELLKNLIRLEKKVKLSQKALNDAKSKHDKATDDFSKAEAEYFKCLERENRPKQPPMPPHMQNNQQR